MLLDSERFGVKAPGEAGAKVWNDAVTRKNDLFLSAGRELLPRAEVQYYSYGDPPVQHTVTCSSLRLIVRGTGRLTTQHAAPLAVR